MFVFPVSIWNYIPVCFKYILKQFWNKNWSLNMVIQVEFYNVVQKELDYKR